MPGPFPKIEYQNEYIFVLTNSQNVQLNRFDTRMLYTLIKELLSWCATDQFEVVFSA